MVPNKEVPKVLKAVAFSRKLRDIESAERAAVEEQIALTKTTSILEQRDLDSGRKREVLLVTDALTGEVMEIEL